MSVELVRVCWVMVVMAVVVVTEGEVIRESAERPRRSASADPTPVTTTDLAALGGLGGLSALTGGVNGPAGVNGAAAVCANQDLLTNLLVYQYLSGNIPGGVAGANPQLAAIFGSQAPGTRTVTTVSKTQTLLSVDVPATTHFSTSTTSYVTTITSIETKIIPVIFRGSRITTTITESSEEVITATEYFTESSVHQPSIVQTLPVHITITETRTRGLDGQYTLFDLTHGATSVIQEPLPTATFDLESTGLDLANLDLSQLDLTSLTGGGIPSIDGDQSQVLAMLSSLLSGSDDSARDTPAPSGRNRNFRHNQSRNKHQKGSRFSPDYADYEDTVDETPKYNVLRGFTLSDRVASVSSGPPSTGRAATDTRYSKYQRKNRPDNNGISTTESTREAERFSASTRRRTLSRTTDRRRSTAGSRPPSTRFVAAPESQYFEEDASKFRPFGQRQNREIASRRRGSLESRVSPPPSLPRARSKPQPQARQEVAKSTTSTPTPTGLSTVLTMYISGSEPGQFFTRLQTIQLRSLGSSRRRRNVNELPITKLSTSTVLPPSSQTKPPISTALPPSPFTTVISQIPPEADPNKVVQMLKQLEPTHVRQMIHSLQKWVDFYSHEVLDEPDNRVVPELTSSLSAETQESENGATTALPHAPVILTGLSLATDRCPAPSTVTTTVYRTVVLTAGINNGESTI